MQQKIFINLPVKNTSISTSFFSKIGILPINELTNNEITCLRISDTIFVMLVNIDKFSKLTNLPIADAQHQAQMTLCLNRLSKEDVNIFCNKALDNGAKEARIARNYEKMYSRSFHDLDGHIWEIIWLDEMV